MFNKQSGPRARRYGNHLWEAPIIPMQNFMYKPPHYDDPHATGTQARLKRRNAFAPERPPLKSLPVRRPPVPNVFTGTQKVRLLEPLIIYDIEL